MKSQFKSKLVAALAFLMLTKSALAGGSSVGNGGNTIVCQDGIGQIISVELLDFYEARIKRGITPDLGDDTLTVDQKVSMAIQRMAIVSKPMADQMQSLAGIFNSVSTFLPGVRLASVDDSDDLFVPAGCQRQQTAIQKTPEFPGDKLFNIDQDLWNHMDSNNRAGLILHEIFYRLALQHGQPEDSVPVRFLVSSIASKPSISMKEYLTVARALKFTQVSFEGYNFVVTDIAPTFYSDGAVLGGPLLDATQVLVQDQKLMVSAISLNEQGQIIGVTPRTDAYLKIGDSSLWFAAQHYVEFSNDLQTVRFGTVLPQNAEFKVDGRYDIHISESASGPIRIGMLDGQLLSCDICQGQFTFLGQTFDIDNFSQSITGFAVHVAHPSPLHYLGQDFTIQGEFTAAKDQIEEINLASPTSLGAGQTTILFEPGPLILYSGLTVEAGVLGEDQTLERVDGKQIPYLKGMLLFFTKTGQVQSESEPGAK